MKTFVIILLFAGVLRYFYKTGLNIACILKNTEVPAPYGTGPSRWFWVRCAAENGIFLASHVIALTYFS